MKKMILLCLIATSIGFVAPKAFAENDAKPAPKTPTEYQAECTRLFMQGYPSRDAATCMKFEGDLTQILMETRKREMQSDTYHLSDWLFVESLCIDFAKKINIRCASLIGR